MLAQMVLPLAAFGVLLSACAPSPSTDPGSPSASTTGGTEAPDAGAWEQLVDEATGMQFQFPEKVEPEVEETVVSGRTFRGYSYGHVEGQYEVVLLLEPTKVRPGLSKPRFRQWVATTLEAADDSAIHCSGARGTARTLRTTCRSVDAQGSDRISMAVAQSWRTALSSTFVAYTAEEGEQLRPDWVSGVVDKLTESLQPGGTVV